MYQIVITNTAKRAVKKLPSYIREEIIKKASVLETNPFLGEKLVGKLSFLYSFHFSFKGTQYRIAYSVDEKEKVATIHLAGPRENFYDRLRRQIF